MRKTKEKKSTNKKLNDQEKQNRRNIDKEAQRIIDNEVDKIINSSISKLPPEILEKFEVMGSVKDKLYNYVNQSMVNMYNHYINTAEDELLKKFDKQVRASEREISHQYQPRNMINLVEKLGQENHFNTLQMESSLFSIYEHLQDYISSSVKEYEQQTEELLDQQSYVGAAIKGENAYSIVKCSFRDDILKPKTVYNVKLSINILDSELISPIFHEHLSIDTIIREYISNHVQEKINEQFRELQSESLTKIEKDTIFKKISAVNDFVDDKADDTDSKRYKYLSKIVMDRIHGIGKEIPVDEYDSLNIRENIKKIFDYEGLGIKGFNTAVNVLTSILNEKNMGYQYLENLKNARKVTIKEYESNDISKLPDERYSINLIYYDQEQLDLLRQAYKQQVFEFRKELNRLLAVVNIMQEAKKRYNTINTFDDLYRMVEKEIRRSHKEMNQSVSIEEQKEWDEFSFISPDEEDNLFDETKTFVHEFKHDKNMFKMIRQKINQIFINENPTEKILLLDRLNFLERQFEDFFYEINPYQLQSGLVLDIDIISIKKIQSTLFSMAGVVNEFLRKISKGSYNLEVA